MSDPEPQEAQRGAPKRSRVMSVYLAVIILCAIVGLVHISHTSTAENVSTPTFSGPPYAYSYTCCGASVVDTIYHPGQTIVIHWSRTQYSLDGNRPATVTLSMGLSGPFRSVSTLKLDSVGGHPHRSPITANSASLRVRDTAADNPVSRILIPKDASSGYYNMTMKTGTKNLWVSGASVIRIESVK